MTDRILYRYDDEGQRVYHDDIGNYNAGYGQMVPVERCEHGNIDPHWMGYEGPTPTYCPGSPTLMEVDGE